MYLKSIKGCCAQAFATVLAIPSETSEKQCLQRIPDLVRSRTVLLRLGQWFPNSGPWPSARPPRHFQWATEPFEQILRFSYTVDIMRFVLKKRIICKTIII